MSQEISPLEEALLRETEVSNPDFVSGEFVGKFLFSEGSYMLEGPANSGKTDTIGLLETKLEGPVGMPTFRVTGNSSAKAIEEDIRNLDTFVGEHGNTGVVLVDHFDNYVARGANEEANEARHSMLSRVVELVEADNKVVVVTQGLSEAHIADNPDRDLVEALRVKLDDERRFKLKAREVGKHAVYGYKERWSSYEKFDEERREILPVVRKLKDAAESATLDGVRTKLSQAAVA